jgi:hypothetical protein
MRKGWVSAYTSRVGPARHCPKPRAKKDRQPGETGGPSGAE